MFVAGLERVDNAKNLGSVSPGARRVGENGANCLLWIDNEHATDGERNSLLIYVCGVLMVNPTWQISPRNYCIRSLSLITRTCRTEVQSCAACRR